MAMIHHISIAAHQPHHVAAVLAELVGGKAAPFPPHPGSYMVLMLDQQGTMIEVYPLGTELIPGKDHEELIFAQAGVVSSFNATHAAISVAMDETQIRQIAEREGWRVVRCDREGLFEVMEVWVENTQLIELLTPAMAARYVEFMQPTNLAQFFAPSAGEPIAV